VVDRSGNRIHLATLLSRQAGGDQRAAGKAGLDHQHAERQAADDAIAPREVARQRPGIERILRHQCTAHVDHHPRKVAVALWIKFLQACAEHANGAPCDLQCRPMSGAIDAQGQPAGDGETGLRQAAGKCPGRVECRRCGTPAAHNGQLRSVEQCRIACNEKQRRGIVDFLQQCRVIRPVPHQ